MGNINTNSDLEFIINLDKKLREDRQVTQPQPNGGFFGRLKHLAPKKLVTIKTYTRESMTEEEMEQLLNIIDKGNYVFYPTNIACGFAVGFGLINSEANETLLMFKEKQMPEGYTFAKLSDYFMRPENIEKAKDLNINIKNDRDYYGY